MTRWWTGLGLGFSLLATSVVCRSSYATPQEAGAGVQQSIGASGSLNHEASKPERWVETIKQPEDHENSVGLQLLKNIAEDQKAVWIGPKNVRWVDADCFLIFSDVLQQLKPHAILVIFRLLNRF